MKSLNNAIPTIQCLCLFAIDNGEKGTFACTMHIEFELARKLLNSSTEISNTPIGRKDWLENWTPHDQKAFKWWLRNIQIMHRYSEANSGTLSLINIVAVQNILEQ